tara:strand:+ start:19938 stop:22334 length:2397 start_codon:yes stop_codon:yes gene_type:complete
MAGFDPAKAARMNQLAQQYPKAPIGTLATLARIPVSDLGNYTTDSVGTRASNANFGRVTSEQSQNVQSTDAPTDSIMYAAARQAQAKAAVLVAKTTPDPPGAQTVEQMEIFNQQLLDTRDAAVAKAKRLSDAVGIQENSIPLPPPLTNDDIEENPFATDFDDEPSPPAVSRSQRDAFAGRGEFAPGPIVPQTPPSRPSTLSTSTQNTVDPGLANAVRAQEQAAIDASNAFTEPEAPDPYPAPPPSRPVESFDAPVDDFSGYPVTQVDDFGGPSRNITQVDDFAEYQAPAQVDDFAEFQAPAQVDDFADYQAPAQVDDFAEINTPAQVDDFSGYSNNNFGTEDPGLDAFGPGPTPPPPANVQEYQQFDAFGDVVEPQPQVDSFDEYSNNDFGIADEEDFSDFATPNQVNTFGVDDFGDNNPLGQVDDFGEYSSPDEVNPFGVDDFGDAEVAQFDEFGNPILAAEADVVENDGESLVGDDPFFVDEEGDGAGEEAVGTGDAQAGLDGPEQAAIQAQALKQKAQEQQTVNEMREASGVKNADGDWRVKLRLAPQATYLYKDPNPGILAPLAITDGIIFPYTPTIDIQYRAEYNAYSPTHSNYQHYFYKNSSVQTVQLQAEFTAQDTIEAEYLLACIHFLKSCSKMFYGQDAQRGSPPPLLYLTGLGEYQFNEAPCAITEFNYNLPNDVNYIRARSRHITRDDDLQFQKPLATATSNGNFSSINRLKTAVTNALGGTTEPLQAGAQPFKPSPGNLGSKGATYVPTKMAMTINLLPIISRQAVSQQFSLKEYANGNLIKKGMW